MNRATKLLALLGLLASLLIAGNGAASAAPACDTHPVVLVIGPPYRADVYVATKRNAPLCDSLFVTGIQWKFDKPGKQWPQHYGEIDAYEFDGPGYHHFALGSGPGHYALYAETGGLPVFPNRLLTPTLGDISGISPVLTTLPGIYGTRAEITYLR